MKRISRRSFLESSTAISTLVALGGFAARRSQASEHRDALAAHVITDAKVFSVDYRWPRFVGKNSRKGFHGQEKKLGVCQVSTDQGATGWGAGGGLANKTVHEVVGKRVSDLISVEKGLHDPKLQVWDLAFHDLMGVILNQPVYQLLGAMGTKATPVYSGMIYMDELNEGNQNRNIDIILENCQWDYDYGYRQFKVKIGRSGKWYPHDEGLAKDIEVVNEIHKAFHGKGVNLLVDANNAYSLQDTIAFLEGVAGVPLVWLEEPFHENIKYGRSLRRWMDDHGFSDTLYADGEADPNHNVLMQLGESGDLNVYLTDIVGHGFTPWRQLMPALKAMQVMASPHAWGNAAKTNYVSHLAAGVGNTVTIEGVTCLSDDIDFGNYAIKDGLLHVSDAPGFGMKLRV